MANSIPKWVMERFTVLWQEFEGREISYEDIVNHLKIDDKNTISVFLNELRTAGWIEVKLNESDTRKRQYSLKSPNEIFSEITIKNESDKNKD
ncbi:hypothetical protein GOV12_04475 [Candidatus Pacearchaeota archaeon]|nr:hypothetical protein [Candidatus Pacearchaeota archaeon]